MTGFCASCGFITELSRPHRMCEKCVEAWTDFYDKDSEPDPFAAGHCPKCERVDGSGNVTLCQECSDEIVNRFLPRMCSHCGRIRNDLDTGSFRCRECAERLAPVKPCSKCEEETSDWTPHGVYCRKCTRDYDRERRSRK